MGSDLAPLVSSLHRISSSSSSLDIFVSLSLSPSLSFNFSCSRRKHFDRRCMADEATTHFSDIIDQETVVCIFLSFCLTVLLNESAAQALFTGQCIPPSGCSGCVVAGPSVLAEGVWRGCCSYDRMVRMSLVPLYVLSSQFKFEAQIEPTPGDFAWCFVFSFAIRQIDPFGHSSWMATSRALMGMEAW